MRTLYLIIGPTGAGKDTVVKRLCDELGFESVVSYTTAKQRSDQRNGVHHWFVDKKTFEYKRMHENIIAYTKIGDVEYMASMDTFTEKTKFYIIDPKGAELLDKLKRPDLRLVKIFISVPENVRKARTAARANYDFDRREKAERQQFIDFDKNCKWDIRVENNDLDVTVGTLKKSIEKIENAASDPAVKTEEYLQKYIRVLRNYFKDSTEEGSMAKYYELSEMEYVLEHILDVKKERLIELRNREREAAA